MHPSLRNVKFSIKLMRLSKIFITIICVIFSNFSSCGKRYIVPLAEELKGCRHDFESKSAVQKSYRPLKPIRLCFIHWLLAEMLVPDFHV